MVEDVFVTVWEGTPKTRGETKHFWKWEEAWRWVHENEVEHYTVYKAELVIDNS